MSETVDPDAEFARQLGIDAHAINTNLPGYVGDPLGGMRVVNGVFSTGEFKHVLAGSDETVTIYRTDTFACVEVSAVGPSGAIITSSYDDSKYWSSGLPDYGLPCDDRYDGIEPDPMVWENPLGLESWEWLISVPGECLRMVTTDFGPVDDREEVPGVVSCDDDWDYILVSKGFIDGGEDLADWELADITEVYCGMDYEIYWSSHDPDPDLYEMWYYPTSYGYEMGDHWYLCLLEK